MLSQEQLDNWFDWHEATPVTGLLYAAVWQAEAALSSAIKVSLEQEGLTLDDRRAICRQAAKAFTACLDASAPDGADKTAAIRCARIASAAVQEALGAPESATGLLILAAQEILKARWQACLAIAATVA
jgi:hypothetical protein